MYSFVSFHILQEERAKYNQIAKTKTVWTCPSYLKLLLCHSRDHSLVAINNHSPIFCLNTLLSVCVKYLFLYYSSVWLGASTSRTINPECVKYYKTTTYFPDIPIFVLSLFWESKRYRYISCNLSKNVSKHGIHVIAPGKLTKARRTMLNGETWWDGLSLLFILAWFGFLLNAIHELVWVYFMEYSEQNKYMHA